MRRASRARWGRIAMFWAVWVALMYGITQLWGCEVASAEELPIPVATIIGECANCSDEGMIAVGNVIRNRAKLRGQTVEEVCLAPKQFSCWNGKGWVVNHIERNRWVIDRAWAAWRASATEDVTLGSDHYFADYIKRPRWAKDMTFKARVGKHLFYRS